ncbi:hypothetical protein HS088_TW13G01709 [Tripterygium wilfordii]|uniref:Uncharacterized protein n=1 Tax=Tripterygium wilfordii TaxID=458696 RepID=A0A7J7CXS5_TRIWF|nr:uncharacterized protein LOC120013545 [Tripterygium wilfordii]KAF5738808.1 hypothetical protein HS088_TW13G01709 [Tripterygium wilfordii]
MGGGGGYSSRRKSSSGSSSCFSMVLNIFRWSCCSKIGSRARDDAYSEEGGYVNGRIYPSDEDGRQYWPVAEPGIDRRATAFIARFYEARVSDPDRQSLAL